MISMKKLGKKFNYKKVLVRWNDITSSADWIQKHDAEEEDYCKTCVSIGWLYSKNKNTLKVFSSYNLDDHGNVMDIGDLKTFPMSVVRKIEML